MGDARTATTRVIRRGPSPRRGRRQPRRRVAPEDFGGGSLRWLRGGRLRLADLVPAARAIEGVDWQLAMDVVSDRRIGRRYHAAVDGVVHRRGALAAARAWAGRWSAIVALLLLALRLPALDWSQRDKQAHAWAGAFGAALLYDVSEPLDWPRPMRALAAAAVMTGVGRLYEENPAGTYEDDDWHAVGYGAAGGAALAWGSDVTVTWWAARDDRGAAVAWSRSW